MQTFAQAFWPATVAFAIWIFRTPLSELITRAKSAKALGTEVTFDQTEDKAAATRLDRYDPPTYLPPEYHDVMLDVENMFRLQLPMLEKRFNLADDAEGTLNRLSADLYITLQFERRYLTLLGGQFRALEKLTLLGGVTTTDEMREVYDTSAILHPEHYKSDNFERWLNYLKVAELIQIEDEIVSLTNAGRAFVPHINSLEFRIPLGA